VTDSSFDLVDLRPKLLQWEMICNTERPHQALGYLTPLQFLDKLNTKELKCHQCTERVQLIEQNYLL